jgi:hypothetical protein
MAARMPSRPPLASIHCITWQVALAYIHFDLPAIPFHEMEMTEVFHQALAAALGGGASRLEMAAIIREKDRQTFVGPHGKGLLACD